MPRSWVCGRCLLAEDTTVKAAWQGSNPRTFPPYSEARQYQRGRQDPKQLLGRMKCAAWHGDACGASLGSGSLACLWEIAHP